MGAFTDLTGQRFGRLIVDQASTRRTASRTYWLCICDCGAVVRVAARHLVHGKTKSCGCLRADAARSRSKGGWTNKGYRRAWRDGGFVYVHQAVMERHLGRRLLPNENVHHINGVRDDNRLENLELWSTSQPSGQRVEDKVAWALELLKLYAPDLLAEGASTGIRS